MTSLTQTQPMPIPFRPRREPATRETEPCTEQSIQDAKDAMLREREQAKRETGIDFDGDRPFIPPSERATYEAVRYDTMQYREAYLTNRVADELSDALYFLPANKILDRTQKMAVYYAACRALRSLDANFAKAAQAQDIAALVTGMREEGGKAFREMPAAQVDALARVLYGALQNAGASLLEGSMTLTPGEYLKIRSSK